MLSHVGVIAFSYPKGYVTFRQMRWVLENFDIDNCRTYFGENRRAELVCHRNSAIKNVALLMPKHITEFLFMDRDVTPTERSMEIFDADFDFVSCRDQFKENKWATKSAFHNHLWRAKREALLDTPPPWFDMPRSRDGTINLNCECKWFRDKVVTLGMTIGNAGMCHHDSTGLWCGGNEDA